MNSWIFLAKFVNTFFLHCLLYSIQFLIHLFLCVLDQHVFRYFNITFNWNELYKCVRAWERLKHHELKWGIQIAFKFYPSNSFVYTFLFKASYFLWNQNQIMAIKFVICIVDSYVVKVLICLVKIFSFWRKILLRLKNLCEDFGLWKWNGGGIK